MTLRQSIPQGIISELLLSVEVGLGVCSVTMCLRGAVTPCQGYGSGSRLKGRRVGAERGGCLGSVASGRADGAFMNRPWLRLN